MHPGDKGNLRIQDQCHPEAAPFASVEQEVPGGGALALGTFDWSQVKLNQPAVQLACHGTHTGATS